VDVVLSPHLDDAVLSCWHVLTQPGEVRVINVFAGVPVDLDGAAWWDRYTGAADSGKRMRERVEEDRTALALAGRSAVYLDLLDGQYRDGEQPLGPLMEQIGRLLVPDARIYAPAAFANHADHRLVREAALQLHETGFSVSLYADLPHAILHGWPGWVRGDRSSEDLAAGLWNATLSTTGVSPMDLVPTVHELGEEIHAAKLAAVHAYRTQLRGLRQFAGRSFTDRQTLGYEVVWRLPSRPKAPPTAESDRAASHP
jgi:LmbE family N-acetylglucosaminyl deacetylase